ncbi:MAG: coenzyme hydrogenase subunit delta [Clostridia bacterium]|nr:coenzyme hydrogenase subunit delta [Clostridia bacterium]
MQAGQVMVIGCGNLLFGDDGFGPAVIEYLEAWCRLPGGVVAVDAGTGAGDLLMDALLGEGAPGTLVLVDAMDLGLPPGTLRPVDLDEIPAPKRADFSAHQFPGLDLLQGLQGKGVKVHLLGCQAARIPEEVSPGLSPAVALAVPEAARVIYNLISQARL